MTRDELPELFALTDAIGARLGAKPLTSIIIEEDINAFYTELGGQRVMGFGVGLWVTLSKEERVAVIAHELAHQVNNDVSRTGLLQRGLYALDRWRILFGDSTEVDHEGYLLRERDASDIIAGGIVATIGAAIDGVTLVLTRLMFVDSQRAEYFADALSTRAGGVAQSVLAKFALHPLIETELRGLVPSYVANGQAFYDRIASAVRNATESDRTRLYDELVKVQHSVDSTHPPTFQRIAFLADILEPTEPLIAYRDAIASELAKHIEAAGAKVLAALEEQ